MCWPDFPFDFLLAALAVVFAYTVFTLVGFGSALVAGAALAQVMPVMRVIPLLALLDCGGSSLRAWRARRAVDWPAFMTLLPGMLLGQLLGVQVLARLPLAWMASALGVFVIVLGGRGLCRKAVAPAGQASLLAAWGHALGGGALGGLFGSGGFMNASYLERRLAGRESFRATQAVLIALSTGWRIVLCASRGMLDGGILLWAAALLPAGLLGAWLGQRIDLKLSRAQLFRLLNGLLVLSGLALLLRHALP